MSIDVSVNSAAAPDRAPDDAASATASAVADACSEPSPGATTHRATRSIRRMAVLRRGERRARRILAIAPLTVFVGVFAVFAALASVLRAHEAERITLGTEWAAERVAYRLDEYFKTRLGMLRHIRDDWGDARAPNEGAFRRHASALREFLPEIVAINWIDANGVIRWLEPERANLAAKGRNLHSNAIAGPVLERARLTGRLQVTPPLELYQGGYGFAVYVPIERDDDAVGYVNGVFRYGRVMRDQLAGGVARSHYIQISDGAKSLHLWSDRTDTAGKSFAVTRHVRFASRDWSVTLWPTAVQIAAARGFSDEIALVLGLLVAAVLASVSYRLARGRALLRTSRERYRNVVDDTPALICRYLPGGTITFVNIAYARSVGKTPRDLIGTSYFDGLASDGRSDSSDALPSLDREHPSRVHERIVRASTGATLWQQWIDRALFDETGAVAEIQSVGLDVTEIRRAQDDLRRSEERFRTIFNSVADGILLFDDRGDLEDVNERACALFGLGRGELLGRGLEVLEALGGAELREGLESASTHGHFALSEWKARRADGSTWQADIELRRTTIAGSPRIVAVVRDTTARAQLAEQLRQAQKMESMGTLAGGIAHDFNNILTAIMGHAELARVTVEDGAPAAQSLEGIVAACEQATGVTRSLLTFSRRGEAPRMVVDMATTVRDTLQLLRPLLPGAIEVTSAIETNEALWVDADTTQVQQVLMNLALNARDAMPDGGSLRVTLSTESTYDSDKAARRWAEDVVIEFRDTGSGMSEEVRRRVVEPFFTTKARERGTGLGMSVVHGIVKRHGGTLEIDSQEGVGTTVRVRLPRREAPTEMEAVAAHEVTAPRPCGARALVVEDNAQVCHLLASVLRQHGFRVDEQHNGATALGVYTEQGSVWDLVVLDVDLPGMTGTECLRRIRESGDDVPAIVVSGNQGFAPDTESSRATRFLQKPFTMREFAAAATDMVAAGVGAA